MTEKIIGVVAKHFQVDRIEIGTRAKLRDRQQIVEAKQAAAYFLWRYTDLRANEIASLLAYRSKQALYEARMASKEVQSVNRSYREEIAEMEKQFLRN